MIKINKGIPMPPQKPLSVRKREYPWLEMEIGDSFFVPGAVADRFDGAASLAGERYGRRFETRDVKGGVRVWRVE